MALKPVLASGVALVSAAAVVAATPEVLRARTLEVAPVSTGTDPAELDPGQTDVTALSMLGALNAFFGDYHGVDPLRPALAPSPHPSASGAGPGEVPRTLVGDTERALYPTVGLDSEALRRGEVDASRLTEVLSADFDGVLVSKPSELFDQIADNLALDAWVGLIVRPVEMLAGAVGLQLNMRDNWRNVRDAVGSILDLAVLLPAQLIVVLRDVVTGFVSAISNLFSRQESEVGPAALRSGALQPGGSPVVDHVRGSEVDQGLEPGVGTVVDTDSGARSRKLFGRTRDALAEQTAPIDNALKDLKAEIKQAREDRRAAWTEAKEQRRQQREEKFKGRFGGRVETVEGADSGTPGGPADTSESTANDPAE